MGSPDATLAQRWVLIVLLALGLFVTALSLALAAGASGERTESGLYVLSFAVILPAALIGSHFLGRRFTARGNLTSCLIWSWGGLLALLLAIRLAYAAGWDLTAGSPLFIAGLAAWWAGSAALARFEVRAPERAGMAVSIVLAVVLLMLGFPPADTLDPVSLVAGAAVGGGLLGGYLLLARRQVHGGRAVALDVLAAMLLFAVASDLGLYANPSEFVELTGDLHHNFYLGPANDVLNGRPMLVETFSQYGVGLFYFLAAAFSLAPIGYGAMALLSSGLSGLQVVLAYAILRLAHTPRPLALVAGVVAAIAIFFAGGLPTPSTHPSLGGLRYVLPYALIASALVAARTSRAPRLLGLLPAVFLGIASIWSIETFAYCCAAFGGMVVLRAIASGLPPAGALTAVLRDLVPAVVAIVVAHLTFALLTFVLGDWPDWGGYLAFLGEYSVNGVSARKMEPWSPGIVIGGVYLASLAGVVLLGPQARRRLSEEYPTLLAIAGMAPFGAVSFLYFVGNSYSDAALLIGLPCFLTAVLWLTLVEHRRASLPRPLRVGALGLSAWMVGMLVVFAWPTIEERAPDTTLALLVPGVGGSLHTTVVQMWNSEPVDTDTAGARVLLDRHFPGDGPALVLATQENSAQILIESGRSNVLPVSHFLQESLVMDRSWPRVKREIEALSPGALMLTEAEALNPDPVFPAPLLQRTAAEILSRFRLARIDESGAFTVVRLAPRTAAR